MAGSATDWTDNRAFSGLLRRAHRAATLHQMVSGEVTDAMRERYGATHSDLDLDELIEPLDYGQGSTPKVADVDRLMSEAGHPLQAEQGAK